MPSLSSFLSGLAAGYVVAQIVNRLTQGANMAHTLTETLTQIRETRGKVESLIVLTNALGDAVRAIPGLTAEQQAQIDNIFQDAADAGAEAQSAIDANSPPAPPTPTE